MIPSDNLKVLVGLINNIQDFKEGNISETLFVMDMQDYIPQLIELKEYIEDLESDITDLQTDLEEAEHSYEELYDDYLMTESLLEAMEEDEDDY